MTTATLNTPLDLVTRVVALAVAIGLPGFASWALYQSGKLAKTTQQKAVVRWFVDTAQQTLEKASRKGFVDSCIATALPRLKDPVLKNTLRESALVDLKVANGVFQEYQTPAPDPALLAVQQARVKADQDAATKAAADKIVEDARTLLPLLPMLQRIADAEAARVAAPVPTPMPTPPTPGGALPAAAPGTMSMVNPDGETVAAVIPVDGMREAQPQPSAPTGASPID